MVSKREIKVEKERDPRPKYDKFWFGADDVVWTQADPLTDDEKAEAAEMWDILAQPGTTLNEPTEAPTHRSKK